MEESKTALPLDSSSRAADAKAGPEVLCARGIYKHFPVPGGILRKEAGRINVLNGIDFSMQEGEILGLVGESGCGKSTLAKLIVKLIEPSSGEIRLFGKALSTIRSKDKKRFYEQVQMIFQDPYSSLDPRMKVGNIVGEMVRIRGKSKDQENREVRRILSEVGLGDEALGRYPHEFSGGQRQRIAIARALVVRPKLLIADEPVSALDLSIQAQVLDLLRNLKERYNLTILFVSHDLDTVATFCDRVAVMYLGRMVEVLPARDLFKNGKHPYLKALLDSIPIPDPAFRAARKKTIAGEVPSPTKLLPGCAFHPRCPLAFSLCKKERPQLKKTGCSGHEVACHRV